MKILALLLLALASAGAQTPPTPLPSGTYVVVVPTPTPSPGTFITPGQTLTFNGNAWTINAGVVQMNGANVGYSANVIELALSNGVIWQENSAGLWWSWNGTTWVSGFPF